MSYNPSWTNSTAQGRLDAGVHAVCLSDPQEISNAINRRLLLTYRSEQDISSKVLSGAYVKQSPIATDSAPPFDNLRWALSQKVLYAPPGGFGGEPPTPTSMKWLWPIAGADENKIIVSGASGVGEDEVGLFQKLNGTTNWTDPALTAGQANVRAVHFNELRQAVEWIRRGRWKMPIYFSAGIFSLLPDNTWGGEAIVNEDGEEVRSLGFALIYSGSGLNNVTVRSSSKIELYADLDCSVGIYHCLRPLDFGSTPNLPTWNKYLPGNSWASPGGLGGGDSTYIGTVGLTAYEWGPYSGGGLTSALQGMIDGEEQHFLVRRADVGPYTVGITGRITIDFDLDTPPN
ncbi:MAG: hypothetical protein ACYSTL_04060 [Planctomycetota bacterium]|jgi:hypothetical protein